VLGPTPTSSDFPFADIAWSPFLAGPLIGLSQLPLSVIVKDNLGCSSTMSIAAAALMYPFRNHVPYSYSKKFLSKNIATWWQCVLVSGVALGAAAAIGLSSAVFARSDLWYSLPSSVTVAEQLIGGAMLVFGARMAGGCTSGHGITGCGHQGLNSYLAVGAMLGAGGLVGLAY